MEEVVAFIHSLGITSPWTAFILIAAVYVIDRSGLVKKWFGVKKSEREQLSEDQADFFARLQEELERADKRHEDCQRQLSIITRDLARWRHLTNNLAQYVVVLQSSLNQAGISAPRFQGWEKFLVESEDLPPEESGQ